MAELEIAVVTRRRARSGHVLVPTRSTKELTLEIRMTTPMTQATLALSKASSKMLVQLYWLLFSAGKYGVALNVGLDN